MYITSNEKFCFNVCRVSLSSIIAYLFNCFCVLFSRCSPNGNALLCLCKKAMVVKSVLKE